MRRPFRKRSAGQRRLSPPEAPAVPPRRPRRPRSSRKPRLVATLSVVWALAVTGWFVYSDRQGTSAFPFLLGEPAAAAVQPATTSSPTATPGGDAAEGADAGANPYVEALAAAEGRASDLQRELDQLRADMVAGDGLPMSDLPVVGFVGPGYADADLRAAFETALVGPLADDAVSRERVLVGVIVSVPEQDGEPFTYTAVYVGAEPLWSTFGVRGEPLPTWTEACSDGC